MERISFLVYEPYYGASERNGSDRQVIYIYERVNIARNVRRNEVTYNVPYRSKGCMVDALASRSDEGRDMAAIRFGEVPNNL